MNRASPEMLRSLNSPGNVAGGVDMSVLERQRTQMKWQLQQQKDFFHGNELSGFSLPAAQGGQFQGFIGDGMGLGLGVVKPDPGMDNGWADTGKFGGDDNMGFRTCGYGNAPRSELSCAISRSNTCQPAALVAAGGGREAALPEKLNSAVGRERLKKRKADKMQSLKEIEEESKKKRIKECAEEGDSKITEQTSNLDNNDTNRETSTNNSKENSKVTTDVQKPDYIHVRARRGQATDSHSLAERVRREKISERMKYLQDLVPGCDKITGKAGMLDEIINYVQSLQKQVEFLSMKLATVNPSLDLNIDSFFPKEMFLASVPNYPENCVSSEMINSTYPLNELLQMGINPDLGEPRRSISAPLSIPETFLDSFCFNQIQPPSTYGADLQNFYGVDFQQGRT
ncbi:hypothetical protein LguiA_008952 [Lonicera macranthoides]